MFVSGFRDALLPNNAAQWRAAQNTRYETSTQPARPLEQPGNYEIRLHRLASHLKAARRKVVLLGQIAVSGVRCVGQKVGSSKKGEPPQQYLW